MGGRGLSLLGSILRRVSREMRAGALEIAPPTLNVTALQESVAVVIPTYNDPKYLRDALSSVFAQTRAVDEVIVVDDGSDQSPAPVLEDFPSVALLRKQNGGLASARNAGLHLAKSSYICFLDADDRLKPNAVASGLACFQHKPQAAMVYGGHYQINADGNRTGSDNYKPIGADPYATLLTGNIIGMHATSLFRRDHLLALGGYDEQLHRGEDYDLYLRLAQQYPIASHPEIIAEYRWHGQNMSSNTGQMLETILSIHDRHRPEENRRLDFWLQGRRSWQHWYGRGQRETWVDQPQRLEGASASDWPVRIFDHIARRILPKRLLKPSQRQWSLPKRLLKPFQRQWPPPRGEIDFGSLASTRPVSMDFGWDRGTPVDRYYVENFLRDCSLDIKGRVLEVGDDSYSCRFGTGIMQQDVLHVNSEDPKVTITGDLTTLGVLPENAFDCIVLTQTLQLIFDLNEAVKGLHAALKPGGVLLLTVPGITQTDRYEWATNWCWSFTATSVHRLFDRFFRPGDLRVAAHGNVFAAICLLAGAVQEELDTKQLDVHDPAYPVIITLRAQKV